MDTQRFWKEKVVFVQNCGRNKAVQILPQADRLEIQQYSHCKICDKTHNYV